MLLRSWFTPLVSFFAAYTIAQPPMPDDENDKEKKTTIRSHWLQMPYIDYGSMENRYWDFVGDTVVNAMKTVRLTTDFPSRQGALWSKEKLNETSWLVEFEFKVHGSGAHIHGDGFAFWFTEESKQLGPVFGSKDYFNGLGVFFDTYQNVRKGITFPYVMGMLGDGKTKYDHDNDGEANRLGGCEANFRDKSFPTKARVKYYGDSKRLVVDLAFQGWNKWENCFQVGSINLPSAGYIGFSALTGDISDDHDILYVRTFGLEKDMTPYASNTGMGYMGVSKDAASSSFKWFLIVLVCVALFYVYRASNSNTAKRF